MNIEVIRAPREAAPVLENLSQYYVYDFSEVVGVDVADDGRFARRPLERWRGPVQTLDNASQPLGLGTD